jgi:hypothetical protein
MRAAIAAAPRVCINGSVHELHLMLEVQGCTTHVHATRRYGGPGAATFAEGDARRMHPGDLVTVYCAGFGTDGAGRLRLFGVDHLVHHAHVRDRVHA